MYEDVDAGGRELIPRMTRERTDGDRIYPLDASLPALHDPPRAESGGGGPGGRIHRLARLVRRQELMRALRLHPATDAELGGGRRKGEEVEEERVECAAKEEMDRRRERSQSRWQLRRSVRVRRGSGLTGQISIGGGDRRKNPYPPTRMRPVALLALALSAVGQSSPGTGKPLTPPAHSEPSTPEQLLAHQGRQESLYHCAPKIAALLAQRKRAVRPSIPPSSRAVNRRWAPN